MPDRRRADVGVHALARAGRPLVLGRRLSALADRRCTLAQSFSDLSFAGSTAQWIGRTPSRTAGLIRPMRYRAFFRQTFFVESCRSHCAYHRILPSSSADGQHGPEGGLFILGREIEFEGGCRSSHCRTAVLGCPIPCRGPNTRVRQRSAVASYLARHRLGFPHHRGPESACRLMPTLFDDDDQRLNSKFHIDLGAESGGCLRI